MASRRELATLVRILTPALKRKPGRRPRSAASKEDLAQAMRWNASGNVIGIGIGPKRIDDQPDDATTALIVFVVSKRAQRKIPSAELIPRRLSSRTLGVRVQTDIVEVGSVPMLQAAALLMPGSNAAHFTMRSGTLTAVVKTRTPVPQLLLLSCCHGFAPPGVAGRQVECPPDLSATTISNWVADVVRFEALTPGGNVVNKIDAAVAAPHPTFVPKSSNNIPGLGRLVSSSPLVSGQFAANGIRTFLGSGAASSLVRGNLLAENTSTLLADHFGRVFLFRDLVAYEPMPVTQAGDSGMPIMINTPAGLQLIGMHIGLGRILGTNRGAAFFVAIGPVLDRLGVDLIV